MLAQGVGPLFGYVGPELCIPPLQAPRGFEHRAVSPDREINATIHTAGGMALVHCHGRMGPVLEGFVRMHCDAVHPVEPPPTGDVTLARAKRRVGGHLSIVGNMQHHGLCTMSTTQLRLLVAQVTATGKVDGRFVLSPTATSFGWPTMTALERANCLAMLEVGPAEGGLWGACGSGGSGGATS